MSLTELISFDKNGNPERGQGIRRLFLSLVIILVATLSFGIGRLTGGTKGQGIKVEFDPQLTTYNQQQTASVILAPHSSSEVVASKNGTKYHFPHCPGAKQIKEANKITFASPQAAEAAGYTIAANCLPR